MLAHPGDGPRDVDPGRVPHGAVVVGDGHDDRPRPLERLRDARAHPSEALDRNLGAVQIDPALARGRNSRPECAAAGRLATPGRPAHLERLASDDGGDGVAEVHGEGVHHPGHRLRPRVHVRTRDVLVGADHRLDLGRVAAGQALALVRG